LDTAVRVALLYKRNAQPDEEVLKLLETQLTARGCQVFIDRQMTIGVDWARELDHQVREADAIIPLLSSASVQSEMLAWEVRTAHEAAQQQKGKPGILPVRVGFTGKLPEELARILDPIQHFSWEGQQDKYPRDN
jgi:hypothetical protein